MTLRFVHISDTHYTPDASYIKSYAAYTPLVGADALVQAVRALPFTPDFILHTGDAAYDPEPSVYPPLAGLMAQFNVPVRYVAGNHDDSHALQTVLMGRAASDVQTHLHYTFDANGVEFICLDSNALDPSQGDAVPSGRVPAEQLAWLEQRCHADDPRPVVVAVHHNVLPVGVPWLDDGMRIRNGEALHAVLAQAPREVLGVFSGHIHQNITVYRDGIMYVSAASSWCQFLSYPTPDNTEIAPDRDTPPGFNVVSIDSGRVFVRRHTFRV